MEQEGGNTNFFKKSYAQVAPLVLPETVIPKACGLKPKKKRPSPVPVRLDEEEKDFVRGKAKKAGMSVNAFIKCLIFGPDYDPALRNILFRMNRELTAQGNNLNEIAKHYNSGTITPMQGESMLDVLGRSMLRTHQAVRNALAKDKSAP